MTEWFDPELYRGVAQDYARFRPAYPDAVVAELLERTRPSGDGVLVDLACGTGQLALALAGRFAEVVAVDQEADMVRVLAGRAPAHVRAECVAVEELELADGSVDLVTVANAFHRLHRERVAKAVRRWLRPEGQLALVWMDLAWVGDAPWQLALQEVLRRYRAEGAPTAWAERRPDAEVLAEAGFEALGPRARAGQQLVGAGPGRACALDLGVLAARPR